MKRFLSYIRYFSILFELTILQIHNMIMAGRGVQEAKDLCQSHAQAALDVLQDVIEPSDARTALENIINALRIY